MPDDKNLRTSIPVDASLSVQVTDAKGRDFFPDMNALREKLKSRKFIALAATWAASFALAWFKTEFVGTAQNLFNFWVLLLGIYFGADVGDKIVKKVKNGEK
jgi:hypothetical protein